VVCSRCHLSQYEDALDSVHGAALQAGNRNAAVCTDCHTAHAVQDWVNDETGETLPEARILIPQTCAQCHNEIYQSYVTSVHGEALTEENNPDVPTCIDCHGVHNIEDPTTTEFRLASPQLCAGCHTDPERMAKYGISTDVLDTYVADFHGTTVTIFEKQSPDQETNKPVCYDCHGVHDIRRADDPEKGLQVKENMLAACQRCHPDASENFPTAWLSHYIPSPEIYPLVYYVDLFYKFFIPTVLGGMGILVVLDASRMVINRRKKVLEEDEVELEAAEATPEEAAPETKTAAPKPGITSEAPVEDEPQVPFESEEADIEPAPSSLVSPPEDEEPPPAQNHTDTTPPGEESNND
jgi:predicted CXXCH cytochrome family protein